MILKFPCKPRKMAFGDSRPENKHTRTGLAAATVGSTSANLTAGYAPTEEETMSYRWMTAILPLKLPTNEKHLLTILAFHANAKDECWASIRLLAAECCVSERHVQRMLRKLTNRGLIAPDFRYGQSTVYTLKMLDGDFCVTIGGDTIVTHNGNLNTVESKCSPERCIVWHPDCTAFAPPYWVAVPKRKTQHKEL